MRRRGTGPCRWPAVRRGCPTGRRRCRRSPGAGRRWRRPARRPAGLGDDRRRALEQHDRAEVGGEPADRGESVGGRAVAGEQAELAVVGRQHGGPLALVQHRGRTVGVPCQREQSVAVDDHRHGGRGDRRPGRLHGEALPAQSRADDEGVEAVQVLEHRAATSRTRAAACARPRAGRWPRRPVTTTRRSRSRRAGRPPRRGARRRSCPGCRQRPARRATTCARSAAAAATTTRRRPPRRGGPAPGACRARCRRPRRRRRGGARRRAAAPA